MNTLLILAASLLPILSGPSKLPAAPSVRWPAGGNLSNAPTARSLPAARYHQDPPVALVLHVRGDVLIRSGGGEERIAAVGTRLLPGDRVIPEAGERALVVLRSGAGREIRAPTTVDAPGAGETAEVFSRALRALSDAAESSARTRPNRGGMIRPLPGVSPGIIRPRNGVAVRDARPTFRWFSVDGVPGYRVQIREDGGEIRRFDAGPDTVWVLPGDTEPLERGTTHFWTVAPSIRGRPAMEAAFRVLDSGELARVEEQIDLLVGSGLDPRGDGAFLAAVIYREAGLLYEAAETLERVADGEDPLSAEAYLLQGEILDALGDLDGARQAFDRADQAPR